MTIKNKRGKRPKDIVKEVEVLYEEIIDLWASEYSEKSIEKLEKLALPLDTVIKRKLWVLYNLFQDLES